MADSQELKILLKVQADASELSKVNTGVATTTAELEGASAAATEFGAVLTTALSSVSFLAGGAIFAAFSQIPGFIEHAADEQVKWREEIEKQSERISEQVPKWAELSESATKFSDVVKLADKIGPDLAAAAALYSTFRTEQLSQWKTWADDVANALSHAFLGFGFTPFKTGLKDVTDSAKQSLETINAAGNAVISNAQRSIAERARLEAEPVKQAISEVESSVTGLQSKLDDLNKKRFDSDPLVAAKALENYRQTSAEYERQKTLLDDLNKKLATQAGSAEKTTDQIALLNAKLAESPEQIATAAAQKAYDQVIQEKRAAGILTTEEVQKAEQVRDLTYQQVLAQEQKRAAGAANRDNAEAERLEHQQIAALLAQESQQLEKIRADMASIESNPFLDVNQKNAAEAQLIPQAIDTLNQKIRDNKAILAGSALDPARIQQVIGAIQKDEQEIDKLQIKMRQTTFGGQLQTSLVAWVNQFGTTAHQIANTITSTIGTAVSGVSNAITGAIFHTQSWGQAFAQVAQQIVGNIINIVIQWAAQQLVMLALHAVFGQTAAATTAGVAAESAAAWAPAATAASIASYGAADAIGTTALAAAMAAGQGIVSGTSAAGGGFAQGGFTGGSEGRIAGFVHGEEFVFSAPSVRAAGRQNLEALHQSFSRPSYEAGGYVGGASRSLGGGGDSQRPIFNQAIFVDPRAMHKWLFAQKGTHKEVIDIVRRAGLA